MNKVYLTNFVANVQQLRLLNIYLLLDVRNITILSYLCTFCVSISNIKLCNILTMIAYNLILYYQVVLMTLLLPYLFSCLIFSYFQSIFSLLVFFFLSPLSHFFIFFIIIKIFIRVYSLYFIIFYLPLFSFICFILDV